MNMNISASTMSANVSQAQSAHRPPPPPPPDHAAAIVSLGSMLSQDAQDSILAGAKELEEAGATFEEIKSFVDGQLEANGVDLSSEKQKSGQLLNITS